MSLNYEHSSIEIYFLSAVKVFYKNEDSKLHIGTSITFH